MQYLRKRTAFCGSVDDISQLHVPPFAGVGDGTQANGRDILGANCSVSLASSMPTLNDGLDRDNVSDQPASGGETFCQAGEGLVWLRRAEVPKRMCPCSRRWGNRISTSCYMEKACETLTASFPWDALC